MRAILEQWVLGSRQYKGVICSMQIMVLLLAFLFFLFRIKTCFVKDKNTAL
jgi:hypothetical protein